MVVKTQCKGRGIIGLDVGVDNVKRFFPQRIPAIDLDLGHLQIRCELTADFWNGYPHITDRRLGAWLEAKHTKRSNGMASVSLDMIPVGKDSYRLQPMSASGKAATNRTIAASAKPETKISAQPAA